jgi:predicted nucleic acid-binding protein
VILVDTAGLYALADRRDSHHREAAAFFRQTRPREVLALPVPVLVESALFIDARLGADLARALWEDVLAGVFHLLPVTGEVLAAARDIDRQYADVNLGLVDCCSLALCEQHRIEMVFTFDRRHFAVYRPTFTGGLTLVP